MQPVREVVKAPLSYFSSMIVQAEECRIYRTITKDGNGARMGDRVQIK